ncbi:MAG: hypothetical protein KDD94_02170, partial [Calditrichaeota bacterium]|nr:hypothetical protein [Calditrichota bacterium]
LKGTDWHNVVNFYKKGSQVKLISIHEALKRCQNRSWRIRLGDTSYVPFSLTSSQKRSLRLLISEFRNTYVHYIPKHWLIEYTGFPKICYDVLDVIKFFVPIVEQNMFLYYDSDLESLKNDLKKCQDIILNSELYRQSLGK